MTVTVYSVMRSQAEKRGRIGEKVGKVTQDNPWHRAWLGRTNHARCPGLSCV